MKTSRKFLIALSLIALFLSAYALNNHFSVNSGNAQQLSCDISSKLNCTAVEKSEWSLFFGIPLGAIGIAVYSGLILLLLFVPLASLTCGLLALSAGMVSYSVYLTYVSHFKIGALCIICLGIHTANLLIFIICLLNFLKSRKEENFLSSNIKGLFANFNKILPIIPVSCLIAFGSTVALEKSHSSLPPISASIVDKVALFEIKNKYDSIPEETLNLQLKGDKLTKDYLLVGDKLKDIDVDFNNVYEKYPVVFYEFSDFECPACQNAYAHIREIQKKYPEKVALILRNFPLDMECNSNIENKIHDFACLGAEIARCAGEDNNFWKVADILFDGDTYRSLSTSSSQKEDFIQKVIDSSKIDGNSIKECLKSDRQVDKILEDVALGIKLNVEATPTIFLNKKRVRGISFKEMDIIVKDIISNS